MIRIDFLKVMDSILKNLEKEVGNPVKYTMTNLYNTTFSRHFKHLFE